MTFTHAVHEFLAEVRVMKARTTAVAYESDLGQLFGHVRPNRVQEFTPIAVLAYLTAGKDAGNKDTTLKRKRAVCASLGKFLVRRGYLPENPADKVPTYELEDALPRPFDGPEVERLLGLLPTLPTMEQMLMLLLLYTGLRISPICGLRVGDVSTTPPALRTVVKRRKEQVIPLHPILQAALAKYLNEQTGLDPEEPILKSTRGGPLWPQRAELLTRRWGKAAGVVKCTPHRFRHTVGTKMLESGVDIRQIQKALGHKSVATTMIYTKVADAAQRAAFGTLSWGQAVET